MNKKPVEPIPPEKKIRKIFGYSMEYWANLLFDDSFIQKLNLTSLEDLKEVRIEVSNYNLYGDDTFVIEFERVIEEDNLEYEKEMKEYKQKLKQYEKDLEDWKQRNIAKKEEAERQLYEELKKKYDRSM